MKPGVSRSESGIALIIVLIMVVVLGILAGGLAYSMKVETQLARNTSYDAEMEWLARSGVDLVKYILAEEIKGGEANLKQDRAGGPGDTNSAVSQIPRTGVQLGRGRFDWEVIDLDQKINVNTAEPLLLRQALNRMGVDAALVPAIADSIIDWRDPDNNELMNGTESDHYSNLNPPYVAKNGPFDDLSELLLVRGITPEMYYGSSSDAQARQHRRPAGQSTAFEQPAYSMGLKDIFTTHSSGMINTATTSDQILECIPGMDPNLARAILTARAGFDGVDGTWDDTPEALRGLGAIGFGGAEIAQLSRYTSQRSLVFQATVDVHIDSRHRQYIALLRLNGRDVQTLKFYWQ